MRKRVSFFCVLAVTIVSTCTCDVDLEPEVVPDNTNWPTNGFDSRIDSTNESDETMECGEAPISDDSLESEEANDTEMISPSDGLRIRGGYQANIKNHPYQVSVRKRLLRVSSYCSGSIISKNWILTAAHCTLGTPSQFWIRAGSRYRRSGGTVYKVSYVYRHIHFKPKKPDYDIGVMRIHGNFKYDEFVQPIPLAKSWPKPGTPVTIAGWGRTAHNEPLSEYLLAVKLTVTRPKVCSHFFPYITPRMFCAGYSAGGRGTCKGDSGAPLVADGVQVGLLYGGKCYRPKLPSVFTSVPFFRDWIRNFTGV